MCEESSLCLCMPGEPATGLGLDTIARWWVGGSGSVRGEEDADTVHRRNLVSPDDRKSGGGGERERAPKILYTHADAMHHTHTHIHGSRKIFWNTISSREEREDQLNFFSFSARILYKYRYIIK